MVQVDPNFQGTARLLHLYVAYEIRKHLCSSTSHSFIYYVQPCLYVTQSRDLETGTLHYIWYGLTYDLSTISAPMGTYPSFAFTPSDSAIIIWAAGKIWYVPLSQNEFGERVAGGDPHVIPFLAHVLMKKADTTRTQRYLVRYETNHHQQLHAFRNLRADEDGKAVVFDAAGVTYYLDSLNWGHNAHSHAHPKKVPVLHDDQAYYSPSFVPGRSDLVIHARWSDTSFTTFELADLVNGLAYEVSGLPLGRYIQPTLCGCTGVTRQIAFVKTAGTLLTGSHIAIAKPGLYIGSILLPRSKEDKVTIKDVHFVTSGIDFANALQLQFLNGNKQILVQQSSRSILIDIAGGPDELGNYKLKTLAGGRMSQEFAVTVQESGEVNNIAFLDFFNVFVINATSAGDEPVWSKPGSAPDGLARVSTDGGHGITWTRSGNRLFWLLGKCFPFRYPVNNANSVLRPIPPLY